MKPILVCCAIILFPDNKILAVQRGKTMRHEGKWEFPGGKIEAGETEEACIRREIMEELGIEIEITGRLKPHIHHYTNLSIKLIPFLAKHTLGSISLKEHSSFRLLDKTELMSPDWAEADIPIVQQLIGI